MTATGFTVTVFTITVITLITTSTMIINTTITLDIPTVLLRMMLRHTLVTQLSKPFEASPFCGRLRAMAPCRWQITAVSTKPEKFISMACSRIIIGKAAGGTAFVSRWC